ncbi:MAG: WS/DGAT/MGAT family O-acyltransferase [Acidimicrobiales bacterium]
MKRLSGSDALFLTLETPSWHQHIAGLTILDPSDAPDFSYETAVEALAERLLLTPKFRWKLKQVPLDLDRPVWVEDTDFDISRHLHRVAVPAPGGRRETADLLGQIMTYQLNRDIPLWEYWYIEGLSGGRVAFVLKFHHALLDGVAGASLAAVMMDLEPDAPTPEPPGGTEGAGSEPTSWELLARSVLPNARTPFRMMRYGTALAQRGVALVQHQLGTDTPAAYTGIPRTRWNERIGPRRTCAFASVSLDDIKKLKVHHDVKVNDVVMALCAGAMRLYLESHDELPEASLVAGVPVSTRAADDDSLDNQIANMNVSLATDIADPVERLLQINRNSQGAKEMTSAVRARKIQSIGETAPPLMLNLAIRTLHGTGALTAVPTMMNTIISNVPGPPFPIYFAGARATGMFPGSVIMEAMGLNITVLSYIDRLDVGLAADPELVPDLWEMADLIPAALAELLTASDLGDPTPVVDAFGETA